MQQHGSKCFAARLPSPTTLGDWGQKVKIQLFQNMAMLDIEYIVITKCSNMVANILPTDPPPTYPSGQKVKIYLFQNMVTSHINVFGITKCNEKFSNILPADPPFPYTASNLCLLLQKEQNVKGGEGLSGKQAVGINNGTR